MRKFLFLLPLLFVLPSLAQTPPPLYEAPSENLPPDLAIEKEKPKQVAPQKKVTPSQENSATETNPPAEKQGDEKQTEPTLGQNAEKTPISGSMEMPKLQEVPKEIIPPTPEQKLPEGIAIVEVKGQPQKLDDAGPARDAGSDLNSALPVTFDRYGENYLSLKDNVDIFKFYARAGEGVALILTPLDANSQLSVDLLGKNGERLSQSQASKIGGTVSFQTSPLPGNEIIYIQIKDLDLTTNQTVTEEAVRRYSLELRPMQITAALPPPPPPPPSLPPAISTGTPTVTTTLGQADPNTPAANPSEAPLTQPGMENPPMQPGTETPALSGEAPLAPTAEAVPVKNEAVLAEEPKEKRKPVDVDAEANVNTDLDEYRPVENPPLWKDPLIIVGGSGTLLLSILFLWIRKRRKAAHLTSKSEDEVLADDEEWEEVEAEEDEEQK